MTVTVSPGPANLLVAGDPIDGFRSGREARLDMVLAEELAVDPAFAAWFLREAGTWRSRPDLPQDQHNSATVRVNLGEYSGPIPEEAYGETDVDLTLTWLDGYKFPVLIEDKIWAPFQGRQPERYAERARVRGGASVLVAPADYIASHLPKADIFHGYVAIEEIIRQLDACAERSSNDVAANRSRWRAQLLRQIVTRPARTVVENDVPTVEFTRFCTEWFETNAPSVITDPRSLRTAGNGWLYFEVPAGLIYKAYGWARKPKAGVDLYLANHGFVGSPSNSIRFSRRWAGQRVSSALLIQPGSPTSSSGTSARRSFRHRAVQTTFPPGGAMSSRPWRHAGEHRTGSKPTATVWLDCQRER